MSQGKESSGGRVNYYLAPIAHPQREEQPAYTAECEDIIDALGMTPDEANVFKEIWRSANERTHGKGKEGNTPLRAAQKMVHYSGRILKKAQRTSKPETQIITVNNWLEWDGGYMPVDGERYVEAMLRSGDTVQNQARQFCWSHSNTVDDIVKYRSC